ncbi:hypothetical protein GCM10009558_057820 [Virgisporangium aurantiacum]
MTPPGVGRLCASSVTRFAKSLAGSASAGGEGEPPRPVVEPDVAAGRPVQPGERPQQRRLAAAVRADQRGDRARRHGDGGLVHHRRAVVAERQPLAAEAVPSIIVPHG